MNSYLVGVFTLLLLFHTQIVRTAPPAIRSATTAAPTTSSLASSAPSPNSIAGFEWTGRAAWQAQPARRRTTPINGAGGASHVIIHHTAAPRACEDAASCGTAVRAVQRAHQRDRGWDDIGYNFLIGGTGVYEGRGFGVAGAHAAGYNRRSLGVALIGDWSVTLPPRAMLDKLKQLIAYGVDHGYIQPNYTLMGHRQVKQTACPGARLFSEISSWPHFMAGKQG